MLHNHARDWTADSSAADAITEPAASVAAMASLADALRVFLASAASRILVTSAIAQAPIGVLSESDLVRYMAR
jgi:CBS domain-containing protein